MVSSGETNLLQKSDCQTLQHIISKAIMNILYWIDAQFFRFADLTFKIFYDFLFAFAPELRVLFFLLRYS